VVKQSIIDERWELPKSNRLRQLFTFRMVRAYAMQADTTKSTEHEEFMGDLERRGPDVPVLAEAKTEYENLK